MNFTKLSALAFAALVSVSAASAQLISNYAGSLYPNRPWGAGNWTGSGMDLSVTSDAGVFVAQTFTAVSSSAIYAYNVQLNVQLGATPTFTTAIYEWNPVLGTLGLPVTSTSTFSFTSDSGFNAYGANVITNPGLGTSPLTAGNLYAIVVQRLDTGTSGISQIGYTQNLNPATSYNSGAAYSSYDNGASFSSLGNTDLAFWVSFDPNSLSPVPEPAVSGTLIGAGFVGLLLARRRRKQVTASAV